MDPAWGANSPVQLAWLKYLIKAYHLPAALTGDYHECIKVFQAHTGFNDLDGKVLVEREEQLWAARQSTQVVRTDWKYVPGQDMPAVNKPDGPTPGCGVGTNCARTTYYCSGFLGTTPNTLYFSDSFWAPEQTEGVKDEIKSLKDDFVRFIKEKYSPQSHEASGGCSSSDKAKLEGPMRAGGKTIVETGWKPTTLPQTVKGP